MRVHVEDYRNIVGDEVIDGIHEEVEPIRGKHIVNVNSTSIGGGVAEILDNMVLLFNDIDVKMGWRIIHGYPDFFNITKKFHNTLQGGRMNLTNRKKKIYEEVSENFSAFTHLDHDIVVIHDYQPLPLIKYEKKTQPWIWRLHIDISKLSADGNQLFNYLKNFILDYDAMIVSMDAYKKHIPIRQEIIMPSIDPLSPKNIPLSDKKKRTYLRKFGVDDDKPFITQVSRFDEFKDPEGVIEVFKRVRKEVDCRLVLIGSMAADDPEGEAIYRRMINEYGDDDDIIILSCLNNILVNALQSEAACVIQKSLREGFALTVSEALWKGTPVVGSRVGGIPAQIEDGVNGYLVNPKDYQAAADRVVKLIRDEDLAREMGERGREIVREKFLVTRHMRDYIRLFKDVLAKQEKTL